MASCFEIQKKKMTKRRSFQLMETSGIEPEVGLEPTTLRFLFLCNKSHTLYRLSYPGRVVDAAKVLISNYIANNKIGKSVRSAW